MSRVESIENERNFLQILKHVDQFATEILETLCERSIEDVELTSSEAMRTSIASMLHAKSANKGRLTNDLPELKAIANELGKKFGKAFAVSCEREKTSEACGVSKRFIAAIAKPHAIETTVKAVLDTALASRGEPLEPRDQLGDFPNSRREANRAH